MTPIQIMALIVALLGGIKLIVILIDPKIWLKKVVKPIYSNPMFASVLGLLIAGVSLYYLNKSFTIVQIFAVMVFFMGLMLMSFAAVSKEMLVLADKVLKKDCLKKFWLPTLVWILLLIWVFYALFA